MNQYDKMMKTSIPRLIISLSIPTVISMLVTNVYNLVDTAFVGKLGTSASAAVGVVFGYMSILQAIGFMFGNGSGSIISRALGKKDSEKASKVASTGIFFAFAVSAVVAILSYIFMDRLVSFLGSTSTMAPYAKTYIFYILITAPFTVAGFVLNNVLRYEGKAFFGMVGLMSGAILNIGGDVLFMFVLHMKIAGAGLSTAISQVISFFVLLYPFVTNKTQCKINFSNIQFNFAKVFDIVGTGLPSMLRQGLTAISTVLLNFIASGYGDAAVSAMSVVGRLFFFIFSVSVGIGQGFQPVCGFSYGAKKFGRLKDAFKFTVVLSMVSMFVLGLLLFIFAPQLVYRMREDMEVVNIGVRALRLQCAVILVLPICMATEMLMQSTGKKLTASLLSATRNGLVFIPILLIMEKLRGISGIQEAQPIAYVVSAIPCIYCAYRFFKKIPNEE